MTTTLDDNFRVLTDKDSAVARVVFRIQFALGEWFLRPAAGIPYIRDVFDERQASAAVEVLKQHILSVTDIVGVDVEVRRADAPTRTLTLLVRLETIYGPAATEVQIR